MMKTTILPDHCNVETCMVYSVENFPILCTSCVAATLDNIKDLPSEHKNELFFTYQHVMESGDYDHFIEDCCEEGDMSQEDYKEIEKETYFKTVF